MNLIIYAGKAFAADFTVVSDDGVTGEQLDPSDTGIFDIVTSGPNPTCVLSGIAMTIIDEDNGVFELVLSADETALLSQDVGFKEDKYSPLSNYLGFMNFTLVSGDRQATVDIYVKEIPSCVIA